MTRRIRLLCASRNSRLLLCFGVVVVVTACAAIKRQFRRPEPLAKVLKFSHKQHVEQAECGDCHEGVGESVAATRGQFIPKKEHGGCGSCHEEEVAQKSKCGHCHLGNDREIALPRADRGLRFSHAAHLKRVKGEGDERCKSCHPGAWDVTRPGARKTVDMSSCVQACHRKEVGNQQCASCHRDLKRQGLRPVVQMGHQGNFIKRHGALARDLRRCASCHDQAHCADCHARTAAMPLSLRFPERIDATFVHRGDYLSRHGVEAAARPDTCRKCHGSKSCSTCHEQRGVAGGKATERPSTQSPHGPDVMTPGAPGFHGRQARRAINRCASCHDRGAASNCVSCHKVGELGGNPHPRGFRWQDKHGACRTNAMCLSCHVDGGGCS